MKTTVISAFPACGKTYAYKHYRQFFNMVDSDSSSFSWGDDGQRHPDWPNNYVDHIESLFKTGGYDFIFVSTHKEVRDLMHKRGIEFVTVYPKRRMLSAWVDRMKDRGDSEEYIQVIRSNWESFMDEIETGEFGIYLHRLDFWQYLDALLLVQLHNLNNFESNNFDFRYIEEE